MSKDRLTVFDVYTRATASHPWRYSHKVTAKSVYDARKKVEDGWSQLTVGLPLIQIRHSREHDHRWMKQ